MTRTPAPLPPSLPSPCISICKMDPVSGFCYGCYRSRDEIAAWRGMEVAEQKALLRALHERRQRMTGRGGRRRRHPRGVRR